MITFKVKNGLLKEMIGRRHSWKQAEPMNLNTLVCTGCGKSLKIKKLGTLSRRRQKCSPTLQYKSKWRDGSGSLSIASGKFRKTTVGANGYRFQQDVIDRAWRLGKYAAVK